MRACVRVANALAVATTLRSAGTLSSLSVLLPPPRFLPLLDAPRSASTRCAIACEPSALGSQMTVAAFTRRCASCRLCRASAYVRQTPNAHMCTDVF